MAHRSATWLAIVVCTGINGHGAFACAAEPAGTTSAIGTLSPEQTEFFERSVRPLLVARCYECHSHEADTAEGELYLDSRAGWSRGGSRGPAIVPHDPAASLILQTLSYEDAELQMPPDRKLPDREIEILNQWIKLGAPDPRVSNGPNSARTVGEFNIDERAQRHWAWQPVRRAQPPLVADAAWPLDPIDTFILRELEDNQLQPANDADRATWLRRVTFDLTGLPPTPTAVLEFQQDNSPEADARVVDRLLESPAFGECWGQHWLDLVRFAETKGHEGDFEIPFAWRYRDYVINAFNQNVPYDEFVREHLAGDLIQPPRIDPVARTNQSIQGTGFWYLGEATHSPVDIRGEEVERIANQVDVFGKTFLGMTIACARCHDHKFDAISTADYYSLTGFIQSSGFQVANVADPEAIESARARLTQLNNDSASELWTVTHRQLAERLDKFEQQLLDTVTLAQSMVERKPTARDEQTRDEQTRDEQTRGEQTRGGNDDPLAANRQTLATEVLVARDDLLHPLHAFSQAVFANTSATPLAERLRDRVEAYQRQIVIDAAAEQSVVATRREGELTRIAERQPFVPERHVVLDFEQHTAGSPWLTSGAAFGDGPVRRGDILLGSQPDRPVALFCTASAATNCQASPSLTGLIRTPTFEVVGDKLWYRFHGKANVFLAVDSHRTVVGPLHGVVKQTIDSKGEDAWFAHPVEDYLGHRVHVEFQPEGDFLLYVVRFGEQPPPPNAQPYEKWTERLSHMGIGTPRAAAQLTVATFRDALADASGLHQPELAALDWVNWLLRHDACIPASQPANNAVATAYTVRRRQLEATIPAPVWATAMLDGSGENDRVHLRGSHRRLGAQPVPRGTLTALGGPFDIKSGSGRLQLANHTASPDNPLTARVQVNRIWQTLFGSGIVASTDNFGELGETPSHPLLLDYLACEFVDDGWDIKSLIRRLVLSRVYRMSSNVVDSALETDPSNRLLHAARVRRLTGEEIRDAILATSGQLKSQTFGPSVQIHITDFMRSNRSPNWSGPMDGDLRRSIYLEVRRNAPSHFLAAFDKPVPFTTVSRRSTSNSPAQPLILLNDPLVHEQAAKWAAQLVSETESDQQAVQLAYFQAFARAPSELESNRILHYVQQTCSTDDTATLSDTAPEIAPKIAPEIARDTAKRISAWTEVCLTLYNVKEFVFLR